MPLFDFKCDKCEKKVEHLCKSDVVSITCTCGGLMKKQLSAPPVRLDGTDPSFPGAYAKWERVRYQNAKQKAKQRC